MAATARALLRLCRRAGVAALLAASLTGVVRAETEVPDGTLDLSSPRLPKLDANRYVTMEAFVVPIVDGEAFEHMFILRLALRLARPGHRDIVLNMTPRLRDALYQMLFRQVSFRTRAPRLPGEDALKADVLQVVQQVVGTAAVDEILLLQAFIDRRP